MSERVSVSEAAAMLGVSRQAIHNRIKSGKYPAEKVIDGVQEYYSIPRDVVEKEASTRDVKSYSLRKESEPEVKGEPDTTSHIGPGLSPDSIQAVDELVMAIRNVAEVNAATVKALEDELARKDLALQRLQEAIIEMTDKRIQRRPWWRRFFGL